MTKTINSRISRRTFNKSLLASSAFAFHFVPSRVWGANERLTVAGIGVGGKGSGDIDQAGNYAQVIAICDIDDQRLQSKANQFPDARKFYDFRELLETMGDKLDAVTVSTADHIHAVAVVAAMRLGKHVYCQKPLTHTVAEARLMRETAQELDIPGGFKTPEQTIHRWGGGNNDDLQKREWMTAIQGGAKPLSNFDFASVLTESMLLGNVAVRLGKAINCDGEHGRVTNITEAASLLSPPRRNGWEL